MLTKAKIQNAKPLTKEHPVPALNDSVLLGIMPAPDLAELLNNAIADNEANPGNVDILFQYSFLAKSILDPDTKGLMFDSADELIATFSGKVPMREVKDLFEAAQDLHGMSTEAIEDLEKNLDETQAGNSGGNSPGIEAMPTPTSC